MSSASKPASLEVAWALVRIGDEIDEAPETLEITGDKGLMRGIREGLRQARLGEGLSVEEILKRLEGRR